MMFRLPTTPHELLEVAVITFGVWVATRIVGDLYILFTDPEAWKWPDDDDFGY
jgi:hypothetical protein